MESYKINMRRRQKDFDDDDDMSVIHLIYTKMSPENQENKIN
jgi:hypothetical protein